MESPMLGSRTWCAQFELVGDRLTAVEALDPRDTRCRVLVRAADVVLGYVEVTRQPHDGPDQILAAVKAETDRQWPSGPPQSQTRPLSTLPDVSIIVCTRDRPQLIRECLQSLLSLTYTGTLEIVVVDNAPSTDETATVVQAATAEDVRIRYVRQDKPGLSAARNAGLHAARYELVAYTDDDVLVADDWIEGIVRGFNRDPRAHCVTGLVCTARITNKYEAYFDHRISSWSDRMSPVVYEPASEVPATVDPLYPFAAGRFGTGANFGFRRQTLLDIGGFDEALGAGTLTKGGEDLDCFARVVLANKALVYEPSAIVWHRHRANEADLRQQMYAYGLGLTAYLTKLLLRAETRGPVIRRSVKAFLYLFRKLRSTKTRADDSAGATAPPGMMLSEIRGYIAGPVAYARALRVDARSRSASRG